MLYNHREQFTIVCAVLRMPVYQGFPFLKTSLTFTFFMDKKNLQKTGKDHFYSVFPEKHDNNDNIL